MTSMWFPAGMPGNDDKTVVSLRLAEPVARAFRVEAAARGLRLNQLFEEMFSSWRRQGGAGEPPSEKAARRG